MAKRINSRQKGCRGERMAAAAWVKEFGGHAERGVQRSGSPDSPDIKTDMQGIHIEVKNVEKGNPYSWIEQSVRDAGDNCPLVMHKRNNQPWLLIMRLEDARSFVAKAKAHEDAEVVDETLPN